MILDNDMEMPSISHDQLPLDQPVLKLSELNSLIRAVIEVGFPDSVWVIAEIAEMRCNARGHCYLELIERDGEETVAQIRATIWAYAFRTISARFERETGEVLKQGMKVLFFANVVFHEVYGLSLNVRDIDPTYSLGEMARKKREIVDRLRKEGLIALNKQVPLPLVPQRIAVISSPTAAGYDDFVNHIERNPFGYTIAHTLFASPMQGADADVSIISALRDIRRVHDSYDVVVIIRGGGSQTDLSCFDSYALASEVARFPLPVITGIGHERDDTVVDMVAHTRLKTPTAVAEFIVSGIRSFEERLMTAEQFLSRLVGNRLQREEEKIRFLVQRFIHRVTDDLNEHRRDIENRKNRLVRSTEASLSGLLHRLVRDVGRIRTGLLVLLEKRESDVQRYDHVVRLLDPLHVLERGYSITYHGGRTLRDCTKVRRGDIITTIVHKGTIVSAVEVTHAEE